MLQLLNFRVTDNLLTTGPTWMRAGSTLISTFSTCMHRQQPAETLPMCYYRSSVNYLVFLVCCILCSCPDLQKHCLIGIHVGNPHYILIIIITRFSCQEAKCVLQTSCSNRLPQSYHLFGLPDPSKTHSTVDMVLSIYTVSRQPEPIYLGHIYYISSP